MNLSINYLTTEAVCGSLRRFCPKEKLIDKRRIATVAITNYARSKNKGLPKVRTVEENGKKEYTSNFFCKYKKLVVID